ncbi:MAG: TetR/AcrR family transcriptional regulator [Synechococcaceae cyanobacterium SM2_3_2]|nr:TetR/AcrR family transcriptional regulator [Synechococcaceae cyanobacterium SM2_3_2]
MPSSQQSTRQRLLTTAKDLFARQGITQTTTRQIAEEAGVNEVTLFRHFRTKQGLLLAAFADLGVFDGIGDLGLDPAQALDTRSVLLAYIRQCYQALVINPELVRSVVGEAGLYSDEHRAALQGGFAQAQQQLANYLAQSSFYNHHQGIPHSVQRLEEDSALLHLLILGSAMLEVTTGSSPLAEPPLVEPPLVEPPLVESEDRLSWILDFWLRGAGLQPTIDESSGFL